MNGNGQLARRVDRLEEQMPGDVVAWFEKARPIMEAMVEIPSDADWNAPGSWFDLQQQLWEVTGSPTWRAVDEYFDRYIALMEARQP